MSYVQKFDGVIRDELLAGHEVPVEIWNINVAADAVIERGMLLCANTVLDEFSQVTSASDASKVLVIARDNFKADSDHKVTTAYSMGKFHREKIKLGGESLALTAFEDAMRKSNLHVTSIQDKF